MRRCYRKQRHEEFIPTGVETNAGVRSGARPSFLRSGDPFGLATPDTRASREGVSQPIRCGTAGSVDRAVGSCAIGDGMVAGTHASLRLSLTWQ
jgi:hypothetical protein